MIRKLLAALAAFALIGAAPATDPATWTQPNPPFRIAGNIYYVGSKGLAAYLITTPRGAILLDGTMPQNVAMVEGNIRALGVKLSDVKILILSHAHFDHAGGLAGIRRDTGAKLAVMAEDVHALETGRHDGEQNYVGTFPPVTVDRVLHDGDTVALGGTMLTALRTPGHTRGCTTWTMTLRLNGGPRAVVFPCSLSVAGNRLVGNRTDPDIVDQYRGSFARLATMKADIVLPAHPEFADVLGRRGTNYLAPGLLAKMVADARTAFDAELARQQAAAGK